MKRGKQKGRGKKKGVYAPVEIKVVQVRLTGPITVGDLAEQLEVGAAAVVKDLMKMGVMASITQTIDLETAITVAKGFEGVVVNADEVEEEEDTLEARLAHLALAPTPSLTLTLTPSLTPSLTLTLALTLTLTLSLT